MAEKRLIDVTGWDSFYADMGDSCNTMDSYDRGYMDALDRADDWIDAQPTVDAVEVVRCEECKNYAAGYVRRDHGWCREWATAVRASGFCHHGERRADGN